MTSDDQEIQVRQLGRKCWIASYTDPDDWRYMTTGKSERKAVKHLWRYLKSEGVFA